MAYRIADRSAEMLYQTGDRTFKMRLDNGVEVEVDVMDIELVADIEIPTIVKYVANYTDVYGNPRQTAEYDTEEEARRAIPAITGKAA